MTPLSTPAPQAQHAQPSLGSREASESAWSDTVLRDQSQPDDGRGSRVDAGDGVAEGEALISVKSSADYRARWKVVQGDFIDEPRKAVVDVDAMVGEVLERLAQTFRQQREGLERDWADDRSTTEELRIALRRYRTFFDRLLTL